MECQCETTCLCEELPHAPRGVHPSDGVVRRVRARLPGEALPTRERPRPVPVCVCCVRCVVLYRGRVGDVSCCHEGEISIGDAHKTPRSAMRTRSAPLYNCSAAQTCIFSPWGFAVPVSGHATDVPPAVRLVSHELLVGHGFVPGGVGTRRRPVVRNVRFRGDPGAREHQKFLLGVDEVDEGRDLLLRRRGREGRRGRHARARGLGRLRRVLPVRVCVRRVADTETLRRKGWCRCSSVGRSRVSENTPKRGQGEPGGPLDAPRQAPATGGCGICRTRRSSGGSQPWTASADRGGQLAEQL